MASIESRSFDRPDDTKTMDKTTMELVDLAGRKIQRTTFQPGWRWSECVGPTMGADRCQVEHIGYAVEGSEGVARARHGGRGNRRSDPQDPVLHVRSDRAVDPQLRLGSLRPPPGAATVPCRDPSRRAQTLAGRAR